MYKGVSLHQVPRQREKKELTHSLFIFPISFSPSCTNNAVPSLNKSYFIKQRD
jgi:peroxiredoxin